MAALTIVADLRAAGYEPSLRFLHPIFNSMRPYGGKAWLPLIGSDQRAFLKVVEDAALPGLEATATAEGVLLSREGPLPGSATWTHQYGDPANTVKSDDSLVKMPLGVLWFGGNTNVDILPRHGHGPPEQVVGGRLFIEGMDLLSARDVYTGRVLWRTVLGDLGTFGSYYDESYPSQSHIPGANSRGTNFVATHDAVYVVQANDCHVLDVATGEKRATFSLPAAENGTDSSWGYIGVYEDLLVAGSGFVTFSRLLSKTERAAQLEGTRPAFVNFDNTASRRLVVMDRHSGEVRWTREARQGFPHNGIALARNTLFCLDKAPPHIEGILRRRGETLPGTYRLLAMDIRTGEVRWEKKKDVFGTWLGYSEEFDILIEARRTSGDMVRGEDGRRIIAYRGEDGTVLWDNDHCRYANPAILHHDRIITGDTMYNLLSGEQIERANPLTGKPMPWTY